MSPLELLQAGEYIAFVLLGVAIVAAIGLHEYAHALAADVQGDRLPRATGRLSLNPTRHLDPLGTILIFLIGFGWGKPVEFRPHALRSQRFGGAIVALAGPAMNMALAVASAAAYVMVEDATVAAVGRCSGPIGCFFLTFSGLNTLLAVFNLLPIPPLDGSRLLTIFLPPSRQRIVYFLDRYGFLILLALLFFGRGILDPVYLFAYRVVFSLVGG